MESYDIRHVGYEVAVQTANISQLIVHNRSITIASLTIILPNRQNTNLGVHL